MKKLGLILAAILCLVVLIVVLLDDSDEAGPGIFVALGTSLSAFTLSIVSV